MQKLMKLGILILTALVGSAFSSRPYISAKIGVDGQYPVGDLQSGSGGGAFGTLLIGSRTSMALTASLGYQYFSKKDNLSSFSQIPVMGGLQLKFGETPFYAAGELGSMIVRSAGTSGAIHDRTNFGWNTGLGTELGPLDLRLTFNSMRIRHSDDLYTVGVNIGFRIWDNY